MNFTSTYFFTESQWGFSTELSGCKEFSATLSLCKWIFIHSKTNASTKCEHEAGMNFLWLQTKQLCRCNTSRELLPLLDETLQNFWKDYLTRQAVQHIYPPGYAIIELLLLSTTDRWVARKKTARENNSEIRSKKELSTIMETEHEQCSYSMKWWFERPYYVIRLFATMIPLFCIFPEIVNHSVVCRIVQLTRPTPT